MQTEKRIPKLWGYKVNLKGTRENKRISYFWNVFYEAHGARAARKRALEEEKGDYKTLEVLSVEKLK